MNDHGANLIIDYPVKPPKKKPVKPVPFIVLNQKENLKNHDYQTTP